MSLKQRLTDDMKAAMKTGDKHGLAGHRYNTRLARCVRACP